jgi:hypothetical protein
LRGASAIQSALSLAHNPHLRVFVVWEPILVTDWGPPSTATLARVHDERAAQFWDREHALSKSLGGPEHAPKGTRVDKIEFKMRRHIWDFVAIYPPGSETPSFTGAPIVSVVSDVHEEMARVARD